MCGLPLGLPEASPVHTLNGGFKATRQFEETGHCPASRFLSFLRPFGPDRVIRVQALVQIKNLAP
jgi:hypothetical protein